MCVCVHAYVHACERVSECMGAHDPENIIIPTLYISLCVHAQDQKHTAVYLRPAFFFPSVLDEAVDCVLAFRVLLEHVLQLATAAAAAAGTGGGSGEEREGGAGEEGREKLEELSGSVSAAIQELLEAAEDLGGKQIEGLVGKWVRH